MLTFVIENHNEAAAHSSWDGMVRASPLLLETRLLLWSWPTFVVCVLARIAAAHY